MLTPGSTKSFTVYISNEGVVPLTLSISTSNWSPPVASDYLTLTWNYGGQAITSGVTVPVTITLKVSTAITGINNFNFDITAVGMYGS